VKQAGSEAGRLAGRQAGSEAGRSSQPQTPFMTSPSSRLGPSGGPAVSTQQACSEPNLHSRPAASHATHHLVRALPCLCPAGQDPQGHLHGRCALRRLHRRPRGLRDARRRQVRLPLDCPGQLCLLLCLPACSAPLRHRTRCVDAWSGHSSCQGTHVHLQALLPAHSSQPAH
jgi:hypothetical protein